MVLADIPTALGPAPGSTGVKKIIGLLEASPGQTDSKKSQASDR